MTAILPQQANVNIYISLFVYLQQRNVQGPMFYLWQNNRGQLKRAYSKKNNNSKWYHNWLSVEIVK